MGSYWSQRIMISLILGVWNSILFDLFKYLWSWNLFCQKCRGVFLRFLLWWLCRNENFTEICDLKNLMEYNTEFHYTVKAKIWHSSWLKYLSSFWAWPLYSSRTLTIVTLCYPVDKYLNSIKLEIHSHWSLLSTWQLLKDLFSFSCSQQCYRILISCLPVS